METNLNQTAKETLKVIHNRKSVRHFKTGEVSKENIEILLKAGMAAPSAVNSQPWEFIVVKNRKVLDEMADGLPHAKMLFQATAAIVVCAVKEKAHRQSEEFAIIDATLASENILLAAESLGLGSIWTAAYPYEDRQNIVRNALNIPNDIIPLNVIPIGFPTGEDLPKEKYNESKIHWEKW